MSASKNRNGPIGWLAGRLLIKFNLIPYMSMCWTETCKENLDKSDLIIFMTDYHLKQAVDKFGYAGINYEVWNVKDIDESGFSDIA